jgi:hypothetical protein
MIRIKGDYMNRLFFMVGLLFILIVPQAGAQLTTNPNPYRQTTWNNITDSVHTWGQTPRQAALTKTRLRMVRAKTRIKNINLAKRKAWMRGQN